MCSVAFGEEIIRDNVLITYGEARWLPMSIWPCKCRKSDVVVRLPFDFWI